MINQLSLSNKKYPTYMLLLCFALITVALRQEFCLSKLKGVQAFLDGIKKHMRLLEVLANLSKELSLSCSKHILNTDETPKKLFHFPSSLFSFAAVGKLISTTCGFSAYQLQRRQRGDSYSSAQNTVVSY